MRVSFCSQQTWVWGKAANSGRSQLFRDIKCNALGSHRFESHRFAPHSDASVCSCLPSFPYSFTHRLQASGSALRQHAADSHIQESSARASLLSLAVARAFRRGRDRLLAARALTLMKNAARARRHASSASERVKALRLSRFLQLWRDNYSHAKHGAITSTSADAFATDFTARTMRKGAQSVLRLWSARAKRRGQRQRGMLAGVERVQHLKQRVAILAWRDACFRSRDSATVALRNRECLMLSNARRGLERWRRVTFGDGGGDLKVDGRLSTGSRVLSRLVGVAVKVDEACGRRRAKEALRRWLRQAKGVRRRASVERWGCVDIDALFILDRELTFIHLLAVFWHSALMQSSRRRKTSHDS